MEIDALQLGAGLLIGAIVAYFAKEAFLERKIRRLSEENADLNQEVLSLKNTLNGRAGLDAKKEKADRMSNMMLEFAAAMQVKDAKPVEVMKAMAAKYPDIAMELVKKGMKLM